MKDNLMADIEINLEDTDPKKLLRSGHHALIMKDYANAAAAIGKAAQLMAQEHGDGHDSMGEVYLLYAKSLLEVSREEASPLGDAIPHGESDDSSEEDNAAEGEKENEQSGDKTEEEKETKENGNKSNEKEAEETEVNSNTADCSESNSKSNGATAECSSDSVEKSEPKEESKEESTEESKEEPKEGEDKDDKEGEDKEDKEGEDKEEPSDLQLAWEVLEVAKNIFTARGDSGKELLSQTLILLGEVGMESENFGDAVKDIQAGLDIQENLYEKTSRKLAETQYKLGIACSTVANIEDAVKYFEKSILTLNERIQLLKEKNDESGKSEILEMEELIPEIKEKINDVKTIKDETAEALMKSMNPENKDGCAATSSTKDVKDISHLVKRKRKNEEASEENEAQPAKKPTP